MQKLQYSSQNYYPESTAIGLILLQTDEVLESEIRKLLPVESVIYHTRVPSGADVTNETLAKMEAKIPAAARLLPPASSMGVIAYCCTSGTTIIGENKVAAAIHSVFPDVKVTNPLSAVKAYLNHLGAKRIGLLTPYEPQVSQAMSDHLQAEGFEISSFGSFYEKEESKVTRISQQSILEAIEQIGTGDQCDAVFVSCTNLRTADLLQQTSEKISKPVVSSNSALAWHINELLRNTKQC